MKITIPPLRQWLIFLCTCLCYVQSIVAQPGICSNTAVQPVFSQTFGQSPNSTTSTTAPAGSTNYNFGNVGTDGNYIVTPRVENANKGDWAKGGDHTGNTNGNMFLVNAGGNNSLFFKQDVTGLCTGTIYNFTAWIANVNSPNTQGVCGSNLVYARVIFRIKDLSGNILASYTTNTLPLSPVNGPLNWIQYGFQFTLPVGISGLTLEMVDFYGGGAQCGNDLALDDILFTACTPALNVSINSTGNICAGATATITSNIQNSPYANPAYQWQRSTNNGSTWVNVGGAGTNNNNLVINNTANGDSGLYRVVVGPDVNSLATATCIATSNSVRLRVISSPQLSITGANNICDSTTLQLSPQVSGGNAPYSYAWTGPSGFNSTNDTARITPARPAQAGSYQLIVNDVNGCTDTASTIVSILANPVIDSITGDSAGCINNTLHLSNTVTGGIWSSNNTLFPVNQAGRVTIRGAGSAIISYTTSNANCSLSAQKTVYSNTVQLPPDFVECNNSAVVVNTNTDYTPVYSNNLPSDKYSWQISGGPYTYIGGTDSTERYPKFKLEGGNIYRIILGYTSNYTYCTDTMFVYRDVPVTTVINSGNDTTICIATNAIDLNAVASGPVTGYTWTSSGSGSFSNNNTAQTTYTFSNADKTNGSVQFYLQANLRVNGICANDNRDTIQVFINQPPSSANAGADRTICVQDSIQLNGNIPAYGNGVWTMLSGPNTPTIQQTNQANTSVSNLTAGTYAFAWTISNICGITADTVYITLINPPNQAKAGNDTSLCAANSFVLNANQPSSGHTGIWSLLSGPNSPLIQDPNNYQTSISNLTTGQYQFVWTISNGVCTDTKDTITVNIVAAPTTPYAGNDTTVCVQNTFQLNANPAVGGIGYWQWINGPTRPVFNDSLLHNAMVSNLASGQYQFSWTVTNGICPILSDTVSITFLSPASQANAGNDTTLCLTPSFQLNASAVTNGTGFWHLISGPSVLTFSDNTNPNAIISNLVAGLYQLSWTSTNGICMSTTDTVSIRFTAAPTSAIAGNDQLLCLTNNAKLNAQAPVTGNGVWRIISGPGSASLQDSTNASTNINNLQAGAYTLSWTVSNGVCTSSSDTAVIVIRPITTTANAGADTSICGWISGTTKSIPLNANKPSQTFEHGQWRIISQPGNAILQQADSNSTLLTIQQAGNYLLEWRIQNDAACNSTDTISISVSPELHTNIQLLKDTAICYGGNTLLNTTISTGNITHWQYRFLGTIAWTDTAYTGRSLQLAQLRQSVEWRVIASTQENNCITTDTSNIIRVTVLDTSNAGILSHADTLCYANNNGILQLNNYTGNIRYWQYSENGGQTWQQISHTASSLNYTNLTATRWYRAIVQNSICDADTSNTIILTVLPGISNNIISSNQQICAGQLYDSLRGSALPTYATAYWQYNTGSGWLNSNQLNTLSLLPDSSLFYAQFRRIATINHCLSDTSNIITLQKRSAAKVRTQISNALFCAPADLSEQIQILPDSNVQTYQWWVNNQLIHSGSNTPNIRIDQPGDSLKLTIIGIHRFGCINDTLTQWFYTTPAIKAGFRISDTTICGPNSIQIINETSDSTLRVEWDFGNGKKSTIFNPPAQTYAPAWSRMDTTYRITLTVFGTCDTVQLSKLITVKALPIASMIATPSFGCSPLDVQFTNQTKGLALQYKLIFDDGKDTSMNSFTQLVHTYHTGSDRTYFAKLIAFNSCGTDTNNIAVPVRVTPNPTVLRVAARDTAACGVLNAVFINNTVRGGTFTWEFGDGTTITTRKNKDTIRHSYTRPGVYTLKVTADNGCSDTSLYKNVYVHALPEVAFINTPAGCIGDSIRFTNNSNPALQFSWNFGNQQLSNQYQTATTYQQAGNYQIQLIGKQNFATGISCADTAFGNVSIVASLPGKLLISDTLGNCTPFNISLHNLSGDTSNTRWQIADSVRTGANIVYTFFKNGQYKITMQSTTVGGCTYTDSTQINILAPTGLLQYSSPDRCNTGDPVVFRASTQHTRQIRWDFGDGTILTTTDSIVTHTYNRPGAFVPRVFLIGDNNCAVSISGIDTIRIEKLAPKFTWHIENNCGFPQYHFANRSSSIFGIRNTTWFINDSLIGQTDTPFHTFRDAGIYQIKMRILSNTGCLDSIVTPLQVKVNEKPAAQIIASSNACEAAKVSINANVISKDSVVQYSWNLGNGNIVRTPSPTTSTAYQRPGVYKLQLIVETDKNCTDTAFMQITVRALPTVSVNAPVSICLGQSTVLSASSSANISWRTQSNTVLCTNCNTIQVQPNVNSRYTVVATDSLGCSTATTTSVNVIQPLRMQVSGNDSICIGESRQLFASGAAAYQWFPSTGLNSTVVAAPIAKPQVTTTYQVIGKDAQNCFTDTSTITISVGRPFPVNAGKDTIVQVGSQITLQPNVGNQLIREWKWINLNNASCTNCPNPTVVVNADQCALLRVRNNFNCYSQDTICIKAICANTQVYVANTFTPDGDGVNDKLFVQGTGIRTVRYFRIYNRWGELVFEKNNFNANDPSTGWDGKVKGKDVNPEVFVWLCEVICDKGTGTLFKGNVAVLR